MEQQSKTLGAGWVITILGAITGAVGVVFGYLFQKSLSVIIIVMAVVFAIGTFKDDVLGLVKDQQKRNEASEIRQLEFERERLRLEAEERQQRLKLEAEQRAREARAQQAREKQRAEELERLRFTETEVREQPAGPKSYDRMNWTRSNRGNIHNGTIYDSVQSVTVANGVITIPTKKEFVNPDPDHSRAMSVFYRVEYYCEAQRKRTTDIKAYSGSNGTGELLYSKTTSDWTEIKHWDPACRDYMRK
jgi:hypothetical protein